MKSNRELIQKADMALADLAPGGILEPKQATRFIKVAIKKNVLTSQVRVPVMTNPEEEVSKMLWTGGVLQPGVSGVALPFAQRTKPSFDKVNLVSKLYKAEVHMPREMLEDQIERGVFKQSVTDFMAEKVAADIERALISGDTASSDAFLAVQDGLLKQATTNVVPGGGAALAGNLLRDLIQARPEEFDGDAVKFYTNRKARSDYRSSLRSAHPDSLGASVVAGQLSEMVGYDGVELVKVPYFPNDFGAPNRTAVLYMDPKNALLGFQRKVTVDAEFRISEQIWAIVVTLRMAIKFEHEPAVAKASDVLG